jgi:hypothetical protein
MADNQPHIPRISTCPHCSLQFRDRFSLAHHMKTHKAPRNGVDCAVCGENMPVNAFWSHIRLHAIDIERSGREISAVLTGNLRTFESISALYKH